MNAEQPTTAAGRTCLDCGVELSLVCWPCFLNRTRESAGVPALAEARQQDDSGLREALERLVAAIKDSRAAAAADVERAGSATRAFGNAPTLDKALSELAAAEHEARAALAALPIMRSQR